jgi:sporulation protein YunB
MSIEIETCNTPVTFALAVFTFLPFSAYAVKRGCFFVGIYTRRFGARFGYILSRNRRKCRLVLAAALAVAVMGSATSAMRNRFIPLALSMAEAKARSVGTLLINEAVAGQLAAHRVSYARLYTVEKNSAGEISAITADTEKMNVLKAELTALIQSKIGGMEPQRVGIPLGSIFNNEFLAGRGPRIPIKLVTLGAMQIDFSNSFVSAGINQTKLDVRLEVRAKISAILPAGTTTAEVVSVIPVAQTVIVGKVPAGYANIAF